MRARVSALALRLYVGRSAAASLWECVRERCGNLLQAVNVLCCITLQHAGALQPSMRPSCLLLVSRAGPAGYSNQAFTAPQTNSSS